MLKKFALCEATPLDAKYNDHQMIRTASGNVIIEPNSEKSKIIEAEIKKHPTALFFRAKAIVADETNSNGDYFPEDELLRSYKSFEGVPFFSNHDNQNVENARGKIIFAEWVPEEKAVYTIAFVDREAFPHICRGIEQDYISGVSMGCSVEYSVCSICGNKAEKTDDYCSHIRNRKGRTFSGTAKNVRTGEVREFRNAPVYEENYGIKFIELSAVVDPACPSCHIEGIIPKDDFLAKKVANVQNSLFMLKTANLEKVAGQQEIEQLNQCLTTLEELSVNLIQNRQQIEVEFASDLVKILSDLQEFTDELIGAGYGNVQGQVPGTAPMGQEGAEAMGGMPPPPAESQTFPVAEETPLAPTEVGSVSGQPSQPLVQSPQLPITAPAKPMAATENKVVRISERLENLNQKLNDILRNDDDVEENDMAKRRTRLEATKQKLAASEKLSNLWEEKQEFLGYINKVPSIKEGSAKLSVKTDNESFIIVAENVDNQDEYRVWTYDDLTSREREMIKESPDEASNYFLGLFSKAKRQDKEEGVSKMAKDYRVLKEAAKEIPETITQDQLNTQDGAMPRENEERNVITEEQLKKDTGSHSRSETPNYLTEKQLENQKSGAMPRENAPRETITQDQLNTSQGASPRTNTEPNTITTNQLQEGGYKVNAEPNVITEKQLDNGNAPWDRAAGRDASMFKGASEHMDAVVSVLADASIATGSTPDEIVAIARSLVDSTAARYKLAEDILEESSDNSEVIDYKKRLAFWSGKNIKVSSVGKKDISAIIVAGLRAVASDQTINPELILDAVDVASDGDDGVQAVSSKIDEKLSQEEETVTVSKRDELRAALKSTVASEEKAIEESAESRESERQQWNAELDEKKPDTMIEASMDEIGLENKGGTEENIAVLEANRKSISSFVKGALAANNVKLAAITNVTVDGDTVQIAVQTGEGTESVEIPLAGEEVAEEAEIIPEGDLAGEGADIIEEELPDVPTEAATYASKNGKTIKIAQAPMGGGIPGTPGDVAGGPGAPEMGMETMPPAGEGGVETLTQDVEEEVIDDEIPEAGEKQPPYAICPECGSNDVDLENEDDGVKGACNNCGAEYEALIKKDIEFTITKPTKSVGEEGGTTELEEPEVPALPVAAQTKLTPNSLKRIASNKEQHGHVCPVCGMDNCKPQLEREASAEYHCPACNSDIVKDVVINVNNPDESYLRVKWLVTPDLENCVDCKEAARKFASMVKVAKRVKEAAADEFPMANCMERVARRFGGNAVATYGPCKGKPLADCLCNQLQALGMRKQRHIERLGSVYTQKDPMDECLEDQKSKGLSNKQAETICGCLKKKFASEMDENPFLMAFAEDVEAGAEKTLNIEELRAINDYVNEEMLSKEAAIDDNEIDEALEEDIGVDLPPEAAEGIDEDVVETVDEVTGDVSEETVTIELSDEAAEELSEALADAGAGEVELVDDEEVPEEVLEDEVIEGAPDIEGVTEIEVAEISPEEEKEMALAMKQNKLRRVGEEVVKVASKPKVIKDIEQDVKAGVPRAKATMGNESAENIDVPMAKPSVPRAKAIMGNESAENIDVPAGLPDVAVDSSYMGVNEKSNQADMPAINNEIRGRVIAKKMKEVDTVEKDVDAGVPRAKATIGNEGADNIDVPMAKPDVPRANAEMGEEGADNINPKADAPDVPIDNAYMGVEKEVQKDMPGINDEYLTRVQAKQELQRERIANARWKKATLVASKLLGEGKIDSEAMEDVVQALSQFGLDEIETKAASMFGKVVKQASSSRKEVTASSGLATPAIVLETPAEKAPEESFQSRIAKQFTIGNHAFSQKLEEEGMK